MRTRSDLPRKVVHTSMGLVGFSFRWLTFPQALGLTLAAVALNRWIMPVVTPFLLRPGESRRGMGGGVVLYPLVVTGLVVAFHDRLELAAAAWGLLAFGDGMASIIGVRAGRIPLPWNGAKTWGGFAAFTLFGAAGALALWWWVSQGRGSNPSVGSSFSTLPVGALVGGFVLAALATAWAESLRVGLDDNVRVGVVGGVAMALAATVSIPGLASLPDLLPRLLWAGPVAVGLALLAALVGGVGATGAWMGALMATAVGVSLGMAGLLPLTVVVALTVAVTRLGRRRKEELGLAEADGGRRGGARVAANLGVATLCALFAVLAPASPFPVAFVAALATAGFDTAATEVGQAFGRTAYSVPRFRRVKPGTEGAISVAGTAAGLLAALAVAGAGWLSGLHALSAIGPILIAALVGSLLESWIASRAPRAAVSHNELLNVLNTAVGAGVAIALVSLGSG